MPRQNRDERKLVLRRRDEALAMRVAGVDYATIGRRLAADPVVNSKGEEYEFGYGWDTYCRGEPPPSDHDLAELARQDVKRLQAMRRANVEHNLDELRDLLDARIERLYFETSKVLTDEDTDAPTKLAAVDRLSRLIERSAKLHGADAPVRTELTGPDGGPVELSAVAAARAEAVRSLHLVRAQNEANRAALEAGMSADPADPDDDEFDVGTGTSET